jgi:hypothetical protein
MLCNHSAKARIIHTMLKKIQDLSVLKLTLILTTVIESITLTFRFGLGLQSTRDTAATVGRLTFGIRIHHGYIGILLAALYTIPALKKHPKSKFLLVLGLSLFFSDIIHHSILYFVTGSSDFDLVYPGLK